MSVWLVPSFPSIAIQGRQPIQRCGMRSDIALSREQRIRDELLLQRRLSKSRRVASALMPTVHRSGLKAKTGRPKRPLVRVKLRHT